ncbi:non-canonical purine NTP pyrophosphatase [Paenibacillus sp. GCM10012306]|uniref:non-canonical purine NTP pyrophosphatase n=1 Tax=Paenibacillus sp. GCM10012306 TaxID=3317342 RepID=UPI00360FC5CA
MRILLATWNNSKKQWLTEGLASLNLPILTLEEYEHGDIDDVEETGDTCEANALLKVRAVPGDDNLIIIAEDSGLFIEVLDGFPGVKTARWMEGSDDDRAAQILIKMKNCMDRKAYFQSALAVIFPNGEQKVVEAKLHGEIAFEARGSWKSGYSRIFEISPGKTAAEVETNEDEQHDHRRSAIQKLKQVIQAYKG